MNLIGYAIKTLRTSKGLTQEQLTAKCNLVGWDISRGTLAKIESKVRRVTDYEICYLAKALGVKEQELFNEANFNPKPMK